MELNEGYEPNNREKDNNELPTGTCQDNVNNQNGFWSRLKKNLGFIFVFAGVIVLSCGVVALIAVKICTNGSSDGCSEIIEQYGLSGGNIPNGITPHISVRIDLVESSCKKPACMNYPEEILRSTAITRDARDCSHYPAVKNSSCFLCNNRCESFDDVRLHKGERYCSVTVSCCLIAAMYTQEGHCGDNGTSKCFTEEVHKANNKLEHDPICVCDDGFKGDKCHKKNTHTVPCTCYKSPLKFINEEAIVECSAIIQPNVTVCHKRTGEYNCLCDTNDASSQADNT